MLSCASSQVVLCTLAKTRHEKRISANHTGISAALEKLRFSKPAGRPRYVFDSTGAQHGAHCCNRLYRVHRLRRLHHARYHNGPAEKRHRRPFSGGAFRNAVCLHSPLYLVCGLLSLRSCRRIVDFLDGRPEYGASPGIGNRPGLRHDGNILADRPGADRQRLLHVPGTPLLSFKIARPYLNAVFRMSTSSRRCRENSPSRRCSTTVKSLIIASHGGFLQDLNGSDEAIPVSVQVSFIPPTRPAAPATCRS